MRVERISRERALRSGKFASRWWAWSSWAQGSPSGESACGENERRHLADERQRAEDEFRVPAAALVVMCLASAMAACHRTDPPRVPVATSSSDAADARPSGEPEAISLLGKAFYPPTLAEETRARLLANLAHARADYQRNPRNEDSAIWLGRRLAYLGRYREAIAAFTKGLADHPRSFKLLRHRGHRYITVRRFDDAISDLRRAASLIERVPDEVEPDGAPNPSNVPRSTSHSNIWYHLGLAHYLARDFEGAAAAYRHAMRFSEVNDDMRCATTHWLYMTLRRLDRDEEALSVLTSIAAKMEILESFAYHKLLLMYKGTSTPEQVLGSAGEDGIDFASLGYGVGNWYLCEGQREAARGTFMRITEGSAWAAFGHIAAEADLKSMAASDSR